jgi:hypothetical protein
MDKRFTMKEIKTYLMDNFPLRANKFTGQWIFLPEGETRYGTPLTAEDKRVLFEDAVKQFPGMTMYAIESIFVEPVWGTDLLAKFGMANGKSYHLRYRHGNNIGLYHAAGNDWFEARHIVRYAYGGKFYREHEIISVRDNIVCFQFNEYMKREHGIITTVLPRNLIKSPNPLAGT